MMSKVAIVTILDNTNYGTYLQALSTGLCIQKLGHQATIVRYIRKVAMPEYQLRQIKAQSYIRYLYHKYYRMPQNVRLRQKDIDFVKQFVDVTSDYFSLKKLKSDLPAFDIYLTGSDQVWNSIYNKGIDKCMYLDFAPDGKKRVAYAASIGMDTIPDAEKEEILKLLKKYTQITVREQQAVNLLLSIGIESQVVLDPTLLIKGHEWVEIANKQPLECKEQFLLVYSVEGGKEAALIEKYATAIAKKRGLKIYEITYNHGLKTLKFADKHYNLATPDVFLNLMSKASFVVVSSFHGTAFAINMNKQFLTVKPDRFSSRVENILSITNLQDRLVKDDSFDIASIQDIDFSLVNRKLETERSKSFHVLECLING